MLSVVGLPIAYRQFKRYKNKTVPKPPYLIYLIQSESGRGADYCNLILRKRVTVELYTTQKDTHLEEKVEGAISAFEYEKYEDYIEAEEMYLASYEFDIYEKTRRKNT